MSGVEGMAGRSARRDVRMDGVEFYRTTADGGVRRILPAGRYSYCVIVRRGHLDLQVEYPKLATLALKAGDVVAVKGSLGSKMKIVVDAVVAASGGEVGR